MFAISRMASKIPSPVVAHAAWMYHFRDVSFRKVIKSATSDGFNASIITKFKKKNFQNSSKWSSELSYNYVRNLLQINIYGASESVGFFV